MSEGLPKPSATLLVDTMPVAPIQFPGPGDDFVAPVLKRSDGIPAGTHGTVYGFHCRPSDDTLYALVEFSDEHGAWDPFWLVTDQLDIDYPEFKKREKLPPGPAHNIRKG